MKRYVLGRKSGVFKLQWLKDDTNLERFSQEFDVWWVCCHTSSCTDYHYQDYKSKGVCGFDFEETLRIGNFTVDQTMTGSWMQVNDFSKPLFTYGCGVRDTKGKKSIIVIKGSEMEQVISKLLNQLSQFECLEDLLALNEMEDKNRWKSLGLADKICKLADIIKLYKKYQQINPATAIVQDMEALIEKRLKEMVQFKTHDNE